jgi:hypothetical protein
MQQQMPATTPIVGSAGAGGGFGASTGTLATGGSGAGATGAAYSFKCCNKPTAAPTSAFDSRKKICLHKDLKVRLILMQGAKSLANAAMTPSGMLAGTALGGSSIINSQELYEQQMRQFEEDEKKRRRDMYANNPEVQLYSASGGVTGFEEGGFVSSIKSSC